MAANGVYAGLQRLLGKKPGAAASAETTDTNEATPPAETPPAGGDEDEDEPTPPADGEPPQGEAEATPPVETPPAETPPADEAPAAADLAAGYQAGVAATNARWAEVLSSPVARANLEMATDLIAEAPNMSASAIIGMCDRYKGEGSARQLLDRTPKPKVGIDASGATGGAGDEGEKVRSAAVKTANRGTGRRAAQEGVPVRKSRRAAAAQQETK